jgi:hypothetical protein
MITARNERIEFNPNTNLLGWMIERKRKPILHTVIRLN